MLYIEATYLIYMHICMNASGRTRIAIANVLQVPAMAEQLVVLPEPAKRISYAGGLRQLCRAWGNINSGQHSVEEGLYFDYQSRSFPRL